MYDIDKMYLMFPSYKFENNKLVYVNYDNTKPDSEQTKEALQNRLIELYKATLLNENVIKDVMTPIDFDHMKNDIRNMFKQKSITNLSLFDPIEDIDVKYSFLAGKAGVGQEANALMDYVLGSLSDLGITNFDLKKGNNNLDEEYSQPLSQQDLDFYKKELNLTDSQVNELKSIKISHSISAILNAFVDIAKDPYITEGNWVTMTTNTGNLLLRKGLHPFYVNAFLAQPIIKEYIEFAEQYESSQNQNINTMDAFIEQRFGTENWENKTGTDILNNNLKSLRDNIKLNNDLYQMNVLSTFLKYQSASKAIKNNIDGSKFMVNGMGKNVTSLNIAKNRVDSILDAENKYNRLPDKSKFRKNIITGFRSKFTNPNGSSSMFNNYYNNIILGTERIVRTNPKLFLSANKTVQNTFNEISHAIYGEILVNDDLGTQLEKDHYSYIMSGFQPLKITVEEKRDLLINFSKEFEQFKNDNKGVYTIIDQMIVKPGENRDFVVLNNRKKSTEFENNMVDSFLDLLNDEPEFTDKLIKYSYLTSGFAMNMNQFFTMIPSQWFSRNKINRYIIDTARNYDSFNEFNEDEFTDQFFLANLENSKFVKNITDSQIEKNSLKTNNGFVMKKAGKQGYFRVKQNEQGNIYYKLIGYNSEYKGVYTRFIPNIKGEYVDVQPLNKKDKKGNRIINFNTDGIMLKPTTTAIGNLYDKTKMEALYKEAVLPRDIYYREDVIEEVDEQSNLWLKNKEILEENNINEDNFNDMIREFGEDYVKEYIKKCKG